VLLRRDLKNGGTLCGRERKRRKGRGGVCGSKGGVITRKPGNKSSKKKEAKAGHFSEEGGKARLGLKLGHSAHQEITGKRERSKKAEKTKTTI